MSDPTNPGILDDMMRADDRRTYRAAFKAGAEAMREAAAQFVETYQIQYASGDLIEGDNPIRSLPLPEPPK